MSESSRHIVVVGASLAGIRVAQGLRTFGYDGEITLIGAEQELPYDRPPLSKGLLLTEWDASTADSVQLLSTEDLEGLDLDLRLGVAATSLNVANKVVFLADSSSISYDTLVIATGAAARPSPWKPVSGVYQLRTVQESRAIAERIAAGGHLVVVGGGFIGTEIAAAARSAGCQVTVVDPVAEPMARLVGPEMASHLVNLHMRHGAQTRFGVGVADITGQEGALTVSLADGTTIEATAAVVGIGSIANTAWLEDSELSIDNGVVVDGQLRAVGTEDVYAIGDVARWPHPQRGSLIRAEHWTNASDQARYIAESLTSGSRAPFEASGYVWSDQYDWKVHTVGWRDPEGRSVFVGDLDKEGRVAVIHEDVAGRACGVVTVNWIRALNQLRRFILQGGTAQSVAEQLLKRV